ncbi:Fatty acid hydroxylase family protein [Brugia pahangi]
MLSRNNTKKWLSLEDIFTNTSLGQRMLNQINLNNLRYTYYLITPNETMFESVDEVPNYTLQVSLWWLLFIICEFCLLWLSGNVNRFALNDSVTSISAGILSQCFKFGGRTIAIFLYDYIWNNFRLIENSWNSPLTWIFCLFFQDFMYYLGHRAIHEIGFLWGFHVIHHSSEYFNYTTALRQAAIQDIGLAIYDVLQAFFIPPSIFLVHRYFSEIYQFTLHTTLFDNYGKLGIILNTPSHHRVHHGRNPYCIDRNYAAVFIIWDKIFGTFEPERQSEKPVYGIINQEMTFNQIYLQFHTLYNLLFIKWRMKTENGEWIFRGIEKLKAIYYPPIYMPKMKVKRYFHWFTMVDHEEGIPLIENEIIRYNPKISHWKKIYCLVHFMLLLAVFFHFEIDRNQLSYLDFNLKLAFFIITIQSLGAFFDRKIYAPYQEVLRCIGVTAYYFYIIIDPIGVQPNRLFMMTIYISSAVFWSVYIASHINVVHHKNTGKNSKMEQISTIKAVTNGSNLPY